MHGVRSVLNSLADPVLVSVFFQQAVRRLHFVSSNAESPDMIQYEEFLIGHNRASERELFVDKVHTLQADLGGMEVFVLLVTHEQVRRQLRVTSWSRVDWVHTDLSRIIARFAPIIML